ncbi:peptidoglycan-binding protein [Streptomyces sp. NPDC049687]|uniref:peptidoglycan-binding domain-containing protein n=1 Tax=Streptomyces sp. NPDC049687 TaxID=3365596 RepID=UPI0037ACF3AE
MTSQQEEGTAELTPVAGGELEPRTSSLAPVEGGGGAVEQRPAESRPRRRKVRIAVIAACAVVVAATAVAAGTGVIGGGSHQAAAAAPSGPPATAKVQRTTLASSQTVDGQLGYGEASAVRAPSSSGATGTGPSGGGAASGGDGIVTWMPSDGDTITRGEPVYKADQKSVPLLYGSVPLYRTLSEGSTGGDVKMLEQNLRALGYRGFTVDDTYSSGTAAAVRKWQGKLGRSKTGEVSVGDAVVATGARRVAQTALAPGDTLTGNVLTWTGTGRVVSVDLDVQYANLAKKGVEATVTLPDNSTVTATVTKVGTPTSSGASSSGSSGTSSSSNSSNSSGASNAIVPVELTAKESKKLGGYQAAAVSVAFASETRPNVLAVPVNALVALPKGGYAVEVVTGSTSEYRPVTLGMFGNGMVEVTGAGITAGTVVGVPK